MGRHLDALAPTPAALFILSGCQQPNTNSLDRLVIGKVMTSSELAENLRALCMPGERLSGTPNGTPNGRKAERSVQSPCRTPSRALSASEGR